MAILFRLWGDVWLHFKKKSVVPTRLEDGQSPFLIEGIQWPDDVVSEWGDDPQMLSNKWAGFEYQLARDIGNEDSNKNTTDRKYHELHVWKTESIESHVF